MSDLLQQQKNTHEVRLARTSPLAGWALLIGGAVFFGGGGMHPSDDPPGLTLKQHLELLYRDPAWYRAHAILLVGMVLMAAGLVALMRDAKLAVRPPVKKVAGISAAAAVLAALGSLLHLVAAVDADRLAAGEGTPITDLQLVVETVTVPAFGFSLAVLALVGAATRTVGNRLAAVPGVVGGVAWGLAGGSILFTDALNFLFPFAAGIGVWAIITGISQLRRTPSRILARQDP